MMNLRTFTFANVNSRPQNQVALLRVYCEMADEVRVRLIHRYTQLDGLAYGLGLKRHSIRVKSLYTVSINEISTFLGKTIVFSDSLETPFIHSQMTNSPFGPDYLVTPLKEETTKPLAYPSSSLFLRIQQIIYAESFATTQERKARLLNTECLDILQQQIKRHGNVMFDTAKVVATLDEPLNNTDPRLHRQHPLVQRYKTTYPGS